MVSALRVLFQFGGMYAIVAVFFYFLGLRTVILVQWYHRRRLRPRVGEAYRWLKMACEPEGLNPEHPGNPSHHAAEARDAANLLIQTSGGLDSLRRQCAKGPMSP